MKIGRIGFEDKGAEMIDKPKHNPNHSGEYGHYCREYDGVYICKDCPEFENCLCFAEMIETILRRCRLAESKLSSRAFNDLGNGTMSLPEPETYGGLLDKVKKKEGGDD